MEVSLDESSFGVITGSSLTRMGLRKKMGSRIRELTAQFWEVFQ